MNLRLPALLRAATLALLASMALLTPHLAAARGTMTRAMIEQYYQRFNAGDPRYAELLADDVRFNHISAGLLKNKAEVVAFYRGLGHEGLREERTPVTIVVDNPNGMVAVELRVRMWVEPGHEHRLPTGETILPGDVWEGHSVMFYSTRGNRIVEIRGAKSGPGKMAKIK